MAPASAERLRPAALQLLHYWWPLVMGGSLTVVIHRATGRPIDPVGLGLLLCGIAAVYSLDRVVDAAPAASGWLSRLLIGAGAFSSAMCALLMWRLPLQTAAIAPLMATIALLYPVLKKVPLAKTILVSVAWTWSVIAFPFNDGSWAGWHWAQLPVAAPLLLLIAAGCLLCDLKDTESDRSSKVSSLPVLLGVGTTAAIAVGLALVGAGVAVLEHRPGLAIAGVCLALVGLRPPLVARAFTGPLLVDAILTLPGVLIAARLV